MTADHLRRRAVPAVLTAVTAVTAVLAAAPAAHAAPSCTRDGARTLALGDGVAVVGLRARPVGGETRRTRVLGCRRATGRRFTLFISRDFGLDSIERNRFTLTDGRFIGAVRTFEGGVSESRRAGTWDAVSRRRVHSTARCDDVNQGDFTGAQEVVFLPRGGLAFTCRQLWVADAKGERRLEPEGTDVRQLAASSGNPFATRLYWTVVTDGTETVRSAVL